ncbi:MAG: V-type ATP synthase subunit A [Erysipelotrichales bacterium]|nr:V-type ATP synthase subunit A [Erysipelotrichales bacterium]
MAIKNENYGLVSKVSGPLIVAKNMRNVHVYDVVLIGEKKLIGEIIELRDDLASIQVYEDTAGIGAGDKVYFTNESLSVELAPGLIENIFDGIQRPLEAIQELCGDVIPPGIDVPRLDRERQWDFKAVAKVGDFVSSGEILGTVDETTAVNHMIMVPPNIKGTLTWLKEGKATIIETIAKIQTEDGTELELPMLQKWSVRKKRPSAGKITPFKPMLTGIRIVDTFFPIAMGGIAAIPGPFGSGKTVVQHMLAKYADADIIVYIGCGERGNEMTDVLREFPELIDPKTGNPLMKRTILIANTSNMPVAAREASIYTGITIAEYYRDMGYKVAIMADSTSRWAEALREMSSRLEEMPGEEGYPAYLSSKLAEFYERAGYVKCLGGTREGSVTIIGAVSPPGGDTSEPVSQATLRIVKVFWGLSYHLAHRRHFPAIDWLRSYSLYNDVIYEFIDKEFEPDWSKNAVRMMELLQEENSLQEIVRLVGMDSLSLNNRAKLLVAQMVREDYLHQDAFHDVDSHTSIHKQYLLSKLIFSFYDHMLEAILENKDYQKMMSLPVREKIGRFKFVEETEVDDEYYNILHTIDEEFLELKSEG